MFKTKANKTLNDIVLGFTSVLNDLEALAQRNFTAAADREQQASDLQAEAEELKAEADEALKVSANVASLLGR